MLIAPAVGDDRLALKLAHIEIAVVAVNGVCDVMKLLGVKSLRDEICLWQMKSPYGGDEKIAYNIAKNRLFSKQTVFIFTNTSLKSPPR